jgi:hypothetical protein
MKHLACVTLVLLGACEPLQNARNDAARLIATPPSFNSRPAAWTPPAGRGSSAREAASSTHRIEPAAAPEAVVAMPAVNLTGKSESEVRALLGPPTTVEENAPGKTWRYRDGRCALDVQLYRDVTTRKFGTLAYEVSSDDNTDEGKRRCLGQLQARAQARND